MLVELECQRSNIKKITHSAVGRSDDGLPACQARNKSRVCSSEWHVLAPPPAAALRCWVEAQQRGERSSNFAAATWVSSIASHLFSFFKNPIGRAASCPSSWSCACARRGRVSPRRGSAALFYCVCLFLRSRWQGFREPSMSAFEVACWWRQGSRVSTRGSLSASRINMKFL